MRSQRIRPLSSKALLAAVALSAPFIALTALFAACPDEIPNQSTCPITATSCTVNNVNGAITCSGNVITLSAGAFSCRSDPNSGDECIDDTVTALCGTSRPCIFQVGNGCVGDPNTATLLQRVIKRSNQCGQVPM